MLAAERFFLAQGKSRVSLDVAGGNDLAHALYESMGYLPISTSMAKGLDPPARAERDRPHSTTITIGASNMPGSVQFAHARRSASTRR